MVAAEELALLPEGSAGMMTTLGPIPHHVAQVSQERGRPRHNGHPHLPGRCAGPRAVAEVYIRGSSASST